MIDKIRRMLKQEEGFTLMELMIAVVIIGILAGIAVPVYNNVQQNAREAVGKANAEMLNRGIQSWVLLENEGDEYKEDNEAELLDWLGLEEVEYVEWQEGEDKGAGIYIANGDPGIKIP